MRKVRATREKYATLYIFTCHVTYQNMFQICYSMRFDQHPFQKGVRNTLTIKAEPLYNFISGTELFVDFLGRPVVSADDVNDNMVFAPYFNQHLNVLMRVTGFYSSLPEVHGKVQCSKSQSLHACKAECRYKYIWNTCRCKSSFDGGNLAASKDTTETRVCIYRIKCESRWDACPDGR